MAGEVKQYDYKVVQTSVEYDNFVYRATIQPEYQRDGLTLEETGRYHVLLLWPLGTVHFLVYKDEESGTWDIDDVEEAEEEAYTTFSGDENTDEEEEVNPLSLEAIIPDVVLENIGEKINVEFV